MFGLNALFAALRRLTASVNTSADLFDAANGRMAALLVIDNAAVEAPALECKDADAEAPAKPGRNGRREKATA